MQNYELGGVLHSPFMQTQIPKRCKKGRFEEPDPNSFFEAPQFKEESQKKRKNATSFLVCPRGLLWTRQA